MKAKSRGTMMTIYRGDWLIATREINRAWFRLRLFRRAKKELSKGQACSSVKTISRILYISTTTKPFTSIDPSVNRTNIEAEQFSFSRNRNIFKAKRSEEKEREREEREKEISFATMFCLYRKTQLCEDSEWLSLALEVFTRAHRLLRNFVDFYKLVPR